MTAHFCLRDGKALLLVDQNFAPPEEGAPVCSGSGLFLGVLRSNAGLLSEDSSPRAKGTGGCRAWYVSAEQPVEVKDQVSKTVLLGPLRHKRAVNPHRTSPTAWVDFSFSWSSALIHLVV